jgi:hypothetical protein
MNDLEFEIPASQEQTLSWKNVLSRSYGLYLQRFGTYFRIALVPALAVCAFSNLEPLISRHFFRLVPVFSIKWAALGIIIGWARGAVYWIISTFFFAAIAATFDDVKASETPAIKDAFTLPRQRLGALTSFALLTWTVFFIGRILAGYAAAELLEYLGLGRNYWALVCAFGLMLVLLSGLLSRFGLAVPELLCISSSSIREAIRNSVKGTKGWQIFFMMFLLKSSIFGYSVYWFSSMGLGWIWIHWSLNGAVYPWVVGGFYLCLAAALESPLFIAFSVLYNELQARAEKSMDVSPA